MTREMRFTDPGEGIHEAEVVELLVAAGDSVEEGDSVLAVETDKATTELPAPYGGRIADIAVAVGDRVEVGDVLLTFAGDREDTAESEPAEAEPEAAAKAEVRQDDAAQRRDGGADDDAAGRQPSGRRRVGPVPAAPSTRRLARELGVALDAIDGSGPGGRVLDADVRATAEREGNGAERAATGRGEAAEAGSEQPATAAPQQAPERGPAPAYEPPDFSRWGGVERVPMRSVRRATAREMARAWAEIPHVMHHDRADITALERFRRAHAGEVAQAGGKLTLTVLVLKAAAAALREMPRFNASLDADGETLVLKHYCHIGVAVATDRGLLVPVVRDVDRKPLRELAVELTGLSRRAREGELSRDEMQGGSFTVTNVGGIGGRLFTPIIRHPEAAILGLARAELTPVATGDPDDPEIGARLLLPLCLAFDHRLNDGAAAARFVNHIRESMQDPESLLLTA
jgi:pyruvate dehydrogenase E2 component (dihydrolipoamide acetyltransferase)